MRLDALYHFGSTLSIGNRLKTFKNIAILALFQPGQTVMSVTRWIGIFSGRLAGVWSHCESAL